MAETAISAVLSKFGELAASEAKILLEAGDNMTLLRDRLEWLQAFIRDADRRRRAGTDQLTRVWVRQTRDVAFQAEDTLDEFAYQVDMKSQGYGRWKKIWRKYLTGLCTQIVSRHVLSARIKRINTRLEKISENQKEYNIGHTPLAPETSSTTSTSSWSDDVVGFYDDAKALMMLLLDDQTRQTFISVLGESGVGKRTIVRILYTLLVKSTTPVFKVGIRYSVPADSSLGSILENLLREAMSKCRTEELADIFTEPTKEDYDIDDFSDMLRRLLANKRYLVVLRGISSKAMLNCVRASLPDDNNGSRVLLILDTENEELAWHANSLNQDGVNRIHMLSRFDEERGGQLFRSRAFRREQVSDRSKEHMTNRYKRIVYGITGGYPLAIVVLAGLLRFKERPGQWEAVLQQLSRAPGGPSRMEGALVPGGGDGEGNQQITEAVQVSTRTTAIERVFWASFEDLPDDLKPCFLYFAALPKHILWKTNDLVRMWMAEGFIKPQKGKTMEDLGHNYLKELVLRCLVDASGTEGVGIHPRLHGFLQSEAREAGFMEFHDMHHVFVPPSVRRLSFMSLGGRYSPFTSKFPKLRSFICSVMEDQHKGTNGSQDKKKKQHGHDLKFLCGSKFLRVIKVITRLRIEELPDRIGDMIHLRYLGMNCTELKELPSSIKRLINLQTLDIKDTKVEMIDPGFWKIRTLRHVLAEKLMLPETIEEELVELQTLSGVKPAAQGGDWTEQNCPLHKMPNLRLLKLHGIEHGKHGAGLKSALAKMDLLSFLKLKGDVVPSCVFTAPSLRFLETVKLEAGTVEWPEVGWDASKVRPNLINVKLINSNEEVPQHIKEKLKNRLLVQLQPDIHDILDDEE